ncbi:unnamed protein product [Urochloa humidicola]
MLFFLSSLALVILDLGTSGRGGIAAFIGVCTIVAVFGIASGHVEGAMTGDLSLMCPEFIQSFSAGMAASGAITSALRLVTKAAFENSRDGLRKGALLFFSISCFFALRFPKAADTEVLPFESRFGGVSDRHGRPCCRWHWKAPEFIGIIST